MLFGSKCYLFKGNHYDQKEIKADWMTAKKWCRDNGGDLAVIDTHSENGKTPTCCLSSHAFCLATT